jgi:hypothetical protein
MKLLALLLLAFLPCCISGPNAADVAADRARWTAVRDVTADGKVDDTELATFGNMMSTWNDKLTADEQAIGKAKTPGDMLTELLRVYGTATVQVVIAPILQQKSPAVFRLIDKNGDGVLSAEEILALDPKDPVTAVVVIQTLQELLTRKHK